MMTLPGSQRKTTDRLPIHWTVRKAVWGRQRQGQDISFPVSNLQSLGSLISDKNVVNQEAIPILVLCLYKADRA